MSEQNMISEADNSKPTIKPGEDPRVPNQAKISLDSQEAIKTRVRKRMKEQLGPLLDERGIDVDAIDDYKTLIELNDKLNPLSSKHPTSAEQTPITSQT